MPNKLNSYRIYKLFVATLLYLVVSISSVSAKDKELFVGAWDMLKFETADENGVWNEMVISDTKIIGNVVYTAGGIM